MCYHIPTMKGIKVSRPRRVSEYRHKYSTQCNYQQAELVIDPENEEAQLYVTYDPAIGGNSMTMHEFHRREFHIGFDCQLPLSSVNKMLTNCRQYAERVVAGYDTHWDGNNIVGVLSEDAVKALDAMELIVQGWWLPA